MGTSPRPDINFIWIDTETGGLECHKHGLLSIAAINGWSDEDWFYRDVRVPDNLLLDPQALRITGSVEDVVRAKDRPEEAQVAREFLQWLKAREPYCFAGMNVKFDVEFLNCMMFRAFNNDMSFKLKARALDIQSLAMVMHDMGLASLEFYGNGQVITKLDSLAKVFGASKRSGDKHDALEDIWLTREVYWRMTDIISASGGKGAAV